MCGHFVVFALGAMLFAGCEKAEPPKQVQREPEVRTVPQEPLAVSSSVEEPESSAEESSSSEQVSSSSQTSFSMSVASPKGEGRTPAPKRETPVPFKEPEPQLCNDVPADALCDNRDGEIYATVKIGLQVWMAENLRFDKAGSWCYNDKPENCKAFGRLYTWTSAVDLDDSFQTTSAGSQIAAHHRGACPQGWHVPSMEDMKLLETFIEKVNAKLDKQHPEAVGTSLKSKTDWNACDSDDEECEAGSNRYGFNAKPAGRRNADGSFDDIKNDAGFWTSAEAENASHAPYWDLYYATDKFWGSYTNKKSIGYSVRCLKD